MTSNTPLHLEPVQSRKHPTTNYENALVDELEAIYGRGVHDLSSVVEALNNGGVRPPDGAEWTEHSFTAELARLGERNSEEANR